MTAYEVRADPPASKPWGGKGFRLAWSLDRHVGWGSRRGKNRLLCSQLPKPQLLTGKSICSLLNCYWYSMFQHIPGKTPNRLRSAKFDTHPQLPSYIHRDISVPAGLIYTCTGQLRRPSNYLWSSKITYRSPFTSNEMCLLTQQRAGAALGPRAHSSLSPRALLLRHESPSPLSHSPLLGMAVLGK